MTNRKLAALPIIAAFLLMQPTSAHTASIFTKAADFSKIEEYGLKYATYSIEKQDGKEALKNLGTYDVLWDVLGKSEEFFLNGDPDAWPKAKDGILKVKLVLDQTQAVATKLGAGEYDEAAIEALSLAIGIVDHPVVNLVWEMSKLTYQSHKAVKESVAALEIEQLYGLLDRDRYLHGTYSPDGPKLIPTDKDTITYFYNKYVITDKHTRELVRTYVKKVIGADFPEYSPSLWERITGTASEVKESEDLEELTNFRNVSRGWIKTLIDDLNKQAKLSWAQMTLRRQMAEFNEFKEKYDQSVKDFDSIDAFFKHWQKLKKEQKNYASILADQQKKYDKALELLNYKNKEGKHAKAREARPLFWDLHNKTMIYAARAAKLEDYAYEEKFNSISLTAYGKAIECYKILEAEYDMHYYDEQKAAREKAALVEALTAPGKTTYAVLDNANKIAYRNSTSDALLQSQLEGMIEYYKQKASHAKTAFNKYQDSIRNILKRLDIPLASDADLFDEKFFKQLNENELDDIAKAMSREAYVSAGPLAENKGGTAYYTVINSLRHKEYVLHNARNNYSQLCYNAGLFKQREYLEKMKVAKREWEKLQHLDDETIDFVVSGYPERKIDTYNKNIKKLSLFLGNFSYSKAIAKLDKLEELYDTEMTNRYADIVYFRHLTEEAEEWFSNVKTFSSFEHGKLKKNSWNQNILSLIQITEGPYANYLRLDNKNSWLSKLASRQDWLNLPERKADLKALNATKFWKEIKKDLPGVSSAIQEAYDGKLFKFIEKNNLYHFSDGLNNKQDYYFSEWTIPEWFLDDESKLDSLIASVSAINAKNYEQYKEGLLKINSVIPGSAYFPTPEIMENLPFNDSDKNKYMEVGMLHFNSTDGISKNTLAMKYKQLADAATDKLYERSQCFRNGSCISEKTQKIIEQKRLKAIADRKKEQEEAYKKRREEEEKRMELLKPREATASEMATVKAFYDSFKKAYEQKQDNLLMSYIDDGWECGDGTTLQDLEDNFRNMFTVYDSLSYSITELKAAQDKQTGDFIISYRLTIKGRNQSLNIQREEQSTVKEMLRLGSRPKLMKTINGTFWYKN